MNTNYKMENALYKSTVFAVKYISTLRVYINKIVNNEYFVTNT